MKKFTSLLLALVLVMSLIPLAASASTSTLPTLNNKKYATCIQENGSYFVVDRETGEVVFTTTSAVPVSSAYKHDHCFGFTTNRDGHFIGCSCGLRGVVDPHDDPATAADGKCWCGYTYMDNADLTVLWFSGMTMTSRLSKDKTEYTAKVWNPNTTELKGTIKTFDARATVEWPEDLTIKEGTNTFEFKVIAEDCKTTKTYTVNVVKE